MLKEGSEPETNGEKTAAAEGERTLSKVRASRRTLERSSRFLRPRVGGGACLGDHGAVVSLQRYLAAGHQHRHDDRYFPDGVSDSEHAEPRQRSDPVETG